MVKLVNYRKVSVSESINMVHYCQVSWSTWNLRELVHIDSLQTEVISHRMINLFPSTTHITQSPIRAFIFPSITCQLKTT